MLVYRLSSELVGWWEWVVWDFCAKMMDLQVRELCVDYRMGKWVEGLRMRSSGR
jgi:hypothetical protein